MGAGLDRQQDAPRVTSASANSKIAYVWRYARSTRVHDDSAPAGSVPWRVDGRSRASLTQSRQLPRQAVVTDRGAY